MRLQLCALWALGGLVAGCDAGPELPLVRRVRVEHLRHDGPPRSKSVRIEGRRLVTSEAHPLRFELLRVEPFWPRHRTALLVMSVAGGRVRALLPAEVAPGTYRLVVFRGRRWRLARHELRVRPLRGRVSATVVASKTPPPGPGRGWPLALLAFLVLGVAAGVWRFARPWHLHHGTALLLLVLIAGCLTPFALLL